MVYRILPLLFFLPLLAASVGAERWEYFIPGNEAQDIAFRDEYVWCASRHSVVRWDRRDGTYIQYGRRHYDGWDFPGVIETDARGTVWMAGLSNGEVSRFDGAVWAPCDSCGKGVVDILADRAGRVWFGSEVNGLTRYDGETWTRFDPNEYPRKVADAVEDASGVLWFAAENGIWSWDGVSWRNYTTADGLPSEQVTSAMMDGNGGLWFGTVEGAVRYTGASPRPFSFFRAIPDFRVLSMVADSSGAVWFGMESGKAARWNGTGTEPFFPGGPELPYGRITDITADRSGRVWFCHGGQELTSFDGVRWERWNPGADNLSLAACDSAGVLWFAGSSTLVSFDGITWTTHTGNDEIPIVILQITADGDGGIWLVGENGFIRRYQGATITDYGNDLQDGALHAMALAVCPAKDGLVYVCSDRGVLRFDGSSWERLPDSRPEISATVHGIAEATDGSVWFATGWGLTRFDGISWRTLTTEDGLPGNVVPYVAAAPDGSVWCSAGGILTKVEGETITTFPGPPGAAPGDPPRTVGPLAVDRDGVVWACAGSAVQSFSQYWYGGVWRLRDGEWEYFPLFSMEEGNKYVITLRADDHGVLWFSTISTLKSWDGITLREYTVNAPNHPAAKTMVVEENGAVWVSSRWVAALSWVAKYDDARWKSYTPETVPEIGSFDIKVDTDGRVWFERARYLDGDSLRWTVPPNEIIERGLYYGFVPGNDGSLWFGTFDNGVCRWKDGTWIEYAFKIDAPPPSTVYCHAVSPDGTVWFSSPTGVMWFDGITWLEHSFSSQYDIVKCISFGPDGTVWIGTALGFQRYDGETWTEIPEPAGLFRPGIHCIAVDRNNVLWAGAGLDSALRFDGHEWSLVTVESGRLPGRVYSVTVDSRNRVWFATSDGYCVLDQDAPSATPEAAPRTFALLGNHPNPFNPSTTISFTLPEPGKAELTIYDITGRKVRELVSERLSAGVHSVVWDGRDERGNPAASGVYLARLKSGGRMHSEKMLLMK